jgi:hypothetical protein
MTHLPEAIEPPQQAVETTAAAVAAIPWLAYGYGLAVALTLGHFLLGLPIQLSDSFGQMLKLPGPWSDLLYGEFTQRGYMRPLMWGELKLVYDMSGGNYFAWFRGAHVVEVVIVVLLYVRLVRPRTYLDLTVLPLGLAVLVGLHTFQGTVREAFPLNHFLTVLIYTLLAANLVMSRPRWWNDVLGVLLFVVSALTIESGLLVWVILVGGWLAGARGISRSAVVALAALLAGYFILRFPILGVGAPDLMERSSGFGFRILDPPELVERFGANPAGFYLYNIAASAMSVLFSEPTGGVFRLTQEVLRLDFDVAAWISPIASLCATGLVFVYVWCRRRAFLEWRLDRDDQLVALFVLVLAANATISYPYTKDVVMSPAGAFLAVVVFAAARNILAWLPAVRSPRMAMFVLAGLALTGVTWGIRVTGTHLGLRQGAFVERNEWAYAEISLAHDGVVLTDADKILFRTLRDDALFVHPAPPPLDPPLRVLLGE